MNELASSLQKAWTEGGAAGVETRLESLWRVNLTTSDAAEADALHAAMASASSMFTTQNNATTSDVSAVGEGASKAGLELAWSNVLQTLQSPQHQYAFREENAYTEDSGSYERGLELFKEGRISEAIQAFEATVQRDPEHSEAWFQLGTCHAENDDDKQAITCMLRARECDPYNLDALLSLGASYVNEMDSLSAIDSLRAWVKHHPKFHGLQVEVDEYSDGSLMDEVTQLMLQALTWSPNDTDVLVVLGVLYNVSQDFNSAVSCFQKALSQRPDDYSLWNKVTTPFYLYSI